jgi:type I restriction enzyme R subunit
VFFKAIRSKTKFWQMIGRGTRLCHDLYGPGQHKQFFNVFDYCQNLEYFSQELPPDQGSSTVALGTRLFRARLEMIAELDRRRASGSLEAGVSASYSGELTDDQLRNDLSGFLQQQVAAMNVDNFVVRPRRKSVEKFTKSESWRTLDAENLDELSEQVADLPTSLIDNDEEAKRFDMLVLRTQLDPAGSAGLYSFARTDASHCQRSGRAGCYSGHQG